ncbi:MAG: PAS domain-containing protein [Planctomycetes bacterium]|nr:PAS domain-containing protein [Planctomycetota bacterium]
MRFAQDIAARETEREPTERALPAAMLDALPEQVCAIDDAGTVVAVNEAWVRFARDNGVPGGEGFLGTNYFDICDLAYLSSPDPENVADGLRATLAGEQPKYRHTYPCHSPATHRWFQLTARPIHVSGARMLLIAHRDVTPWITMRGQTPAQLNSANPPDARPGQSRQRLLELIEALTSITFEAGACRKHLMARPPINPEADDALTRICEQVDRASDLARAVRADLDRRA